MKDTSKAREHVKIITCYKKQQIKYEHNLKTKNIFVSQKYFTLIIYLTQHIYTTTYKISYQNKCLSLTLVSTKSKCKKINHPPHMMQQSKVVVQRRRKKIGR